MLTSWCERWKDKMRRHVRSNGEWEPPPVCFYINTYYCIFGWLMLLGFFQLYQDYNLFSTDHVPVLTVAHCLQFRLD